MNDDLIAPLVSESFTNSSAEMSVRGAGTAGIQATASSPELTLAYNAIAGTYTLTVASRSKTFGPADLNAAKSTNKLAVYEISSGGVTDTLTLTKPGTVGRVTYRWVGGAFWEQRNTANSTVLIDVAAYGVPTRDNSVPRSGAASYAVDLMGYETHENGKEVDPITGSGQIDVDFAKGLVVTSGTFTRANYDPVEFDGKATLHATDNGFTGTFSFYDYAHFIGTLDGSFYGPTAQEVGATFSTQDTKGNAAIGVLVGRKDNTLGVNSDFEAPTKSQFFSADSHRISVTHDSAARTYSGIGHDTNPVIVHYDPVTDKYMLISGDRAAVHTVEQYQQRFYPVDRIEVYQSEYRPSFKTLKYVTGMSWASRILSGQSTQYDFRDFVYGFPTAGASVPTTGRAGFELTLGGTIVDKTYDGVDFPTSLSAQVAYPSGGVLLADFGAGTLSLDARLDVLAGHVDLRGEGAISSAANAFSGTLTADGPDNDYTGTFNGRFYGPGAAETGGTFFASNGPDALLTGYFVGERNPALIDVSRPLAAYTDPATFVINTAHGPTYVDTNEELDFDPDAGKFVYKELRGSAFVPYTIEASDIVAGTEDDDRIRYETDEGDRQLSGWVHNIAPGNGEIELTYSSFAAFRTTHGTGPVNERDNFITFGNTTPPALIPRTGSGSYSGIAVGAAELGGIGYNGTVSGTSNLVANFNAASLTSKLVLFTDEVAPRSIGTFLFNGNIFASGGFGGNASEYPAYSGGISGDFYGPHADEYGYAWTVNYYTSAPGGGLGNTLYGIAVGKKDP